MPTALQNNLTLNWTDLTSISDLTYHDQNKAGVYIWGFTIDKDFIPYYVGIAENIIFRIHEHINFIIGGRYTIYHRDSLARFKEFKNQEIQADKSKGRIYIPDWPYGYKNFLDNRKELQPHIKFMIDTFTFTFAVVDREIISWQDLKEIEKTCIKQIGKENLENTRGGRSDKYLIKHTGNPTVTEKIKATNSVSSDEIAAF